MRDTGDRTSVVGAAAVLAAALTAGGCGNGGDGGYFPLDGGRTWDYEVRRSIKGEQHHQRLVLTSLPAADIDGTLYYPQKRLDDRIDLFTRSANGIARTGFGGTAALPVLPAEPKAGATWQAPGQILFLEVTGAFHATFQERKKQTIDLDFVIESVDDTVDVSAGRFEHCLRVKASGSMFAGATLQEFLGIRFIQVEQTEWYAPGVGLVKRVRKESTTPAEWNNDFEQELVAVY
jgi:hypothetical protein